MEINVGHFELRQELPGSVRAAWRARRIITDGLAARISPRSLQTVHLLLTELVTNAFAFGAPASRIGVDVTMDGDQLDVCVSNDSTGESQPALVALEPSVGGVGLHLVDRLADDWGTRLGPRTDVWLRLTIEPRPAAAG